MVKIILTKTILGVVKLVKNLGYVLSANGAFLLLMFLYLIRVLVMQLKRFKINTDKVADGIEKFIYKVDGKKEGDVSRVYLIELAIRNLKAKKTRAFVTIGGMALGVGAIVFLVSLGYGLERLVIGRVARLDELRMTDVAMGGLTISRINDDLIKQISSIDGVEEVIPMVSMVSKVTYKNSVLDIMALGVDDRYIKAVGAKIIAGSDMKTTEADKNISLVMKEGSVKGASREVVESKLGEKIDNGILAFNIAPETKVALRESCSNESDMLGYIVREEGGYVGEKVWGQRYFGQKDENIIGQDTDSQKEMSPWVRTEGILWRENNQGNVEPILNKDNNQAWGKGCVMENQVTWEDSKWLVGYSTMETYLNGGEVLGITDEASGSGAVTTGEASNSAELFDTVVTTDESGVEWVELKQTSTAVDEKKTLPFFGNLAGEAYVSSNMLQVIGLTKDQSIGEKFKVAYIVPDGLIPGSEGKNLSDEVEYTIKGVIDDGTANYYYFKLADAQRLGITNYSQLKVVAKDQNVLGTIRKNVESMGMKTASTVDTVAEIEKLFGTIRLILGILGTIALAVAALGMFNTMTVSLLERTREVGVMKSMGMLSEDVRELFLAESMIMGVGGGLFGVLLGLILGKTVSLVLTSISVVKGQGAMDVSYVPFFFVAFIMLVSFVVGVLTGWYPSKRARAISALNALRYE